MKLKKCNAVLALLTILALLVHVGYNVFAYFTYYYNPTLKTLTVVPIVVFACAHAITGMCSVFLLDDGTRLDVYRKQNRGTIVQRVSAAFIFPLLIVHLQTFSLLQNASDSDNWIVFGLVLCAQVVFYAAIAAHTATSFSKAFITLGLLSNRKVQVQMDRVVIVVCIVLFVAAAIVIISAQLGMFLSK